jgi:hypothetical protein
MKVTPTTLRFSPHQLEAVSSKKDLCSKEHIPSKSLFSENSYALRHDSFAQEANARKKRKHRITSFARPHHATARNRNSRPELSATRGGPNAITPAKTIDSGKPCLFLRRFADHNEGSHTDGRSQAQERCSKRANPSLRLASAAHHRFAFIDLDSFPKLLAQILVLFSQLTVFAPQL